MKRLLFITLLATGIALLSEMPYYFMAKTVPAGAVYMGSLGNNYDQASYLSWIKEGQEGKLLFEELYTTEKQSGLFFNPFFLACGQFTRLTGLDIVVSYHIIRLLLVICLVFVLYLFSGIFFAKFWERYFSVTLVSLGSGIGFLFSDSALNYLSKAFNLVALDLWVPETTIFSSMTHKPLFLAALILIILCFYFQLKALKSLNKYAVYASGLFGLLLALVHPYDLASVYAALFVFLLWSKSGYKRWLVFAGFMAISAPGLLYQYLFSHFDQVFRSWAGTVTVSGTPYSYLVGYGIFFVLAAAYAWQTRGKKKESELFLLSWVTSHFIIAYLPLRFERRLVLGLMIPLGLLTAMWFFRYAVPFLRKKNWPVWGAALALCLITLPSNFRFVAGELENAKKYPYNYALPANDFAALKWMDAKLPKGSTVFAFFPTGVYIPGMCGLKVYAGHYDQTVNAEAKRKDSGKFYEKGASAAFKKMLLAKSKAQYVYYGSFEASVGPFQKLPVPAEIIYDIENVKILRLNTAASRSSK